MKWPFILLLILPCFAEDGVEWTTLFNGKTLAGWKPASSANWRVEDSTIAVDEGDRGLLVHEDTCENCELTVDSKPPAAETDVWRRFELQVENGRVMVKLDDETALDHQADPPAGGNLIDRKRMKCRMPMSC